MFPWRPSFQFRLSMTTLGIELRLLPGGNGSLASVSDGPRFEPRVSHVCTQFVSDVSVSAFSLLSLCPGDGGITEMMTSDGDVVVQLVGGVVRSGLGFRNIFGSALSDLFLRSARPNLVGESTANFTFRTFRTKRSVGNSGGRQIAKTGSYVDIGDFRLKKVPPAYGLEAGIVDFKLFDGLGPFFGFFNVTKSEDFESVYPSENQMDIVGRVGSVDGEQGKTARIRPVAPCSWRRLR